MNKLIQGIIDRAKANRQRIVLPEATEEDSPARKAGFKTISEITIARNKAVYDKIKASYEGKLITPEDQQQIDQLGFKVFQ